MNVKIILFDNKTLKFLTITTTSNPLVLRSNNKSLLRRFNCDRKFREN